MKKIILLIFIFINICFFNLKEEVTTNVSLVINDNSFNIYTLITKTNTKNILKYINSDIKIINIYPKIKTNYNNNLKNYVYKFTVTTNQNNINLFTNEYRKLLIENNYVRDANLISFNGIDILKIDIHTNETNLLKLLSTNKFELKNKY